MTQPKSSIRSFVIRAGRMTTGQRRALEENWPKYGLSVEDGRLDPVAEFGNKNPLTVEIGFGMGDSLLQMAEEHAAMNFIGVEVYRPGVGHLLRLAAEKGITNLRVYCADTVKVFESAIAARSVDRIQIFFPDPWPKKRHHKRRLLNREFMTRIEHCLALGGMVHIATDWAPYGEEIRALMLESGTLEPVSVPARPLTKYEKRGNRLGHEVVELAFKKMAD
ncbi:MAG: tRNA (guanosine(46)-N7)-methyltransferase TrmB [Pseudomonadales bacterium]